MTLTIPQSEGHTHWKLGLQMDQNIRVLHARTSDASMTILEGGGDTFEIVPLAKNDFKAPTVQVNVEYYFDNRKDIEANSGGEIPRWRYPCVAKVVTCDLKVWKKGANYTYFDFKFGGCLYVHHFW